MIDRVTAFGKAIVRHHEDPVVGGITPHEVIFTQNKASVRYFKPANATRTPVFVSMPLINTWTVFDLLPGKSTVQAMLDAGAPVYLLDWGRPGPEDADVTMSELVDKVLKRCMARSLRHAREHHGATELDALGYCVGGTFLTVHLARHPESARRLALLCAPIDFTQMGRMNTWADPASFPLDDIIDSLGNFPADLMKTSFQWLRPEGNISKWRSLFDGAEKESFFQLWSAMETWNSDAVDFYGEAYREYVRNCYFENRLVEGGWTMAGAPVNPKAATMPALAISASKDHICPPAAAEGLVRAWGGPTKSVVIEGGHVGVCVGKELPKVLKAWIDEGHASA